ncbi:hypothetical protein QWZ08_20070 [Ferruginibacter paludis]|uniref:hypothetical protein n=1 Tax=Ferruginibacter paludis TaxID=1310417 RepID=UPI0025B446FA|nr:hypothetical protein [Ferruginibacter paludis]MDN3657961.1 hypothetical protein [Ferruginibacter paludis]
MTSTQIETSPLAKNATAAETIETFLALKYPDGAKGKRYSMEWLVFEGLMGGPNEPMDEAFVIKDAFLDLLVGLSNPKVNKAFTGRSVKAISEMSRRIVGFMEFLQEEEALALLEMQLTKSTRTADEQMEKLLKKEYGEKIAEHIRKEKLKSDIA